MLEERLQPILYHLRERDRERKDNYKIVKDWFQQHEENLADSPTDMAFVCELPHSERSLLTYPVVGNWYLSEMRQFRSQTEHQSKVYTLIRRVVAEGRFKNHHMRSFYDNAEDYNRMFDELNSLMLSDPDKSTPLHQLMQEIMATASREINTLPYKDTYTVDLGHGVISPLHSFAFLTWYFDTFVKRGQSKPLDLSIMVIDDEHPEEWYSRIMAVGFKEQEGQQGTFHDCESALKALEKGRYDVILTDLELGDGKMDGMKFAEKAFKIQKRKGIVPRISVFSYNDQKLQEAERKLGRFSRKRVLFHQVNYNNKAEFSATRFRLEVGYTLEI